jgi:hypothetical protein
MTKFLTGIAVVLSFLSLLLGSFATYQVLNLRDEVGDLSEDAFISKASSRDSTSVFKTKAKVELLSVKRVQNPDTQNRDIVNVQYQFRQLSGNADDGISLGVTTARNPKTNEIYRATTQSVNRTTSPTILPFVERNFLVDVWFRIPEEVNTVDLSMVKTQGQALKNVPIPN